MPAGLSPILYDIFIDSLLHKINLPSQAFVDYFKFVADVLVHSRLYIQSRIDIVVHWAGELWTLLSVKKCLVMHCGTQKPHHTYLIKFTFIKRVKNLRDLCFIRTPTARASEQCNNIVSKAIRMCGAIRRAFHSRHRKLLWPAFTSYNLPILSYCSPSWSL